MENNQSMQQLQQDHIHMDYDDAMDFHLIMNSYLHLIPSEKNTEKFNFEFKFFTFIVSDGLRPVILENIVCVSFYVNNKTYIIKKKKEASVWCCCLSLFVFGSWQC